jgi:dihydrodipicolinate synthase/N-acetylneuraminate lyase
VRLYELTRAGRHEEALALQQAIAPLAAAVTTGYGVPGLKAAMALNGYRPGQPRRPLGPIDDDGLRKIRGLLETLSTRAEALTVS